MPKKRQTTLLSMFSGYEITSLSNTSNFHTYTHNRGSAMAITPDSSKKKKIRKRNESAANDRAKRKRRDHLLRRLRQNTDSLSKDQKRVLTIVGSGHNGMSVFPFPFFFQNVTHTDTSPQPFSRDPLEQENLIYFAIF